MKIVREPEIISKIHIIRNEKVMLDFDLSLLYNVETKYLKRQVRRNIGRFPSDFMFELTDNEFKILRSQIGTSSWGGSRYKPMAFTEQGVAQLSSVINSERAIEVNIQIIRLFTRMRKLLLTHKDLILRVQQLENVQDEQEENISIIFEYMNRLIEGENESNEPEPRKRIGFNVDEEDNK